MAKRTRRRRLESWLSEAATPIFLIGADRKVRFVNTGFEKLTGWSAEEVCKQQAEYTSNAEAGTLASLLGSICPPAEVFSGEAKSIPTYIESRSGDTHARTVRFIPLRSEQDSDNEEHVDLALGIVTRINEKSSVSKSSSPHELHAELAAMRIMLRNRYGLSGVVAGSASMKRVMEQVRLACQSDVSVTLFGEMGTGKEHLARVIHHAGKTQGRAFVPLMCGELPARQLKQTLDRVFNPEPDEAPTIPARQPGTLFLVQVERLPRDLQTTILGASNQATKVWGAPIRLMASTTVDLREAMESDLLLPELYFSLTSLEIALPPLRERLDDLDVLAQHALEECNKGSDKQISGFDGVVLRQFPEYNWPGNLDELTAVISEAHTKCVGTSVGVGDLPFRFRTGRDAQALGPSAVAERVPLEQLLEQVEREEIEKALQEARSNKSKAADLLGLTRAKLYRRMEQLGISDDG